MASELWTDLIDAAEATGYAREAMNDYEARKGSLTRWLPNRFVDDIEVKFVKGENGLIPEARYRAIDAEPEFGVNRGGKRITVELPAVSQQGIISERDQMRLRRIEDDAKRKLLFDTIGSAVRAIADRVERQRGTVLTTGKATITQDNYVDETDFGRDPSMNITARALFSDPAADRIGQFEEWLDTYRNVNGEEPGSVLMGSRVMRTITQGQQFGVQLVGGGTRPATQADARAILQGAGVPEIYVFDRRTSGGRVIPDDSVILLPTPVDPVDPNAWEQTSLGATFWGTTLAATEPEWNIEVAEQPGIVAAAFTNRGIPPIRHTYADSLSLPVLANANLAMAVKVL